MTSNSASFQWLIFLAILLAIGLAITCFLVWLYVIRQYGKKKRKRRHRSQSNQKNPTLAQTGGLPPPRKPGEPPRGM